MRGLLGERTTLDATTAVARGQEYVSCSGNTPVVCEVGSITAHTCLTAVKKRRLGQIVRIVEPVPVWLVTLVAAFFTECCLVGIGDVSVPGQEVALICGINIMCGPRRSSRVKLSEDSQFHGSRASG